MSFSLPIYTIVFSHLVLLAAPALANTPIVRTQDLVRPTTAAENLLAQKTQGVKEELVVTDKKKDKPTATPVYPEYLTNK